MYEYEFENVTYYTFTENLHFAYIECCELAGKDNNTYHFN